MARILRRECLSTSLDSFANEVVVENVETPIMTDRIDATNDKVVGKVKEESGKLTGDKETQVEGKLDQLKGGLKDGVADLKDKGRDLADKLTGDDKH